MEGIVTKLVSGDYTVRVKDQEYICKPRGLFRHKEQDIYVGDRVIIDENNIIIEVLERKNLLLRPSVANIDQVILVFSLKEPELNLYLLDRMIAYYEYLALKITIVFSKTDLDLKRTYLDIVHYYKNLYQVYLFSKNEENDFTGLFTDKISVLSGQSGVGKSTLLNSLGFNLKTQEISQALGRGKHTTRHVELYKVLDGLVMDTPGFGIISLEKFNEIILAHSFKEFFSLSHNCRFATCLHINEPNCAVKEALEKGKILKSRYENYLLLHEEVKEILKKKY
ncbi:MAG TPA: ribosome small subunit-dependent GTPase A [Bacilli bacterium]|nr:ribosome small subunit-dependent GTPase A [Bacilli bacterium]HOR53277.1 ribosome small subunit-dependent GTPase A [Bacilli bacterium]